MRLSRGIAAISFCFGLGVSLAPAKFFPVGGLPAGVNPALQDVVYSPTSLTSSPTSSVSMSNLYNVYPVDTCSYMNAAGASATVSTAVTMTLPGSPAAGQYAIVTDTTGCAAMSNIVVSGTVNGASSYTISSKKQMPTFVYVGGTAGWTVAGETGPSNVLTIAAANSTAQAQQAADIVLSENSAGATDDVIINALLASFTNGGKVLCKSGIYSLYASATISQDWTTLEGETGYPWWNSWTAAYPNGAPGGSGTAVVGAPGGCQLQMQITTTTIPILALGTSNYHGSGDNRRKGVWFRNLYLVGKGYSQWGINDAGHCDMCGLAFNSIQKTSGGIQVAWDNPTIQNNNIQDINGAGILIPSTYSYGTISSNTIFDLYGPCISVANNGAIITQNICGDVSNADGFVITGSRATISNNQIHAVPNGHGISLKSGAGLDTFSGNVVSLYYTQVSAPNHTANTAYDALAVGIEDSSAVSNNTFIGNTFENTSGTATTGYAAAFYGSTATKNIFMGNIISGTVWNSSSGTTNVLVGTGNTFLNNTGCVNGGSGC